MGVSWRFVNRRDAIVEICIGPSLKIAMHIGVNQ